MNNISVKIDVKKISKQHLFQGSKGTYLDLLLIARKDGPDQYGNDFMAVQSVSKEEREAGVKGPILGNAKVMGSKPSIPRPAPKKRTAPVPVTQPQDADDEVPF